MTYTKETLDKIQKELNTAVLCDILDDLGYRYQAMDGGLYPLEEDYKLVGVARTVLAYDVFEQPKEAYATEIEAVDSLKEGDIAVCVNKSCNNGFWGELMTNAAIARGARGAIIDGAVRDITQIKELSASSSSLQRAAIRWIRRDAALSRITTARLSAAACACAPAT